MKPGADLFHDPSPFELELGGFLPEVTIGYETWGELSPQRDNAILVCPAFSAHSHLAASERDPSPGWWEGTVGPGLAFDPIRHFVVCPSLLGGSYGTTGPTSTDPRTKEPYRGHFPVITVRDIVNLHMRLLDHLGIECLAGAVGGSLGGMETLELAIRHPGRVRRCVTISGTDATRPYTAAIRHMARQAIMLDPSYKGGHYSGYGPVEGLRLAREVGTLFYRSREEFNERFDWEPIHRPSLAGVTFDVQSYLDYQGRKIIGVFDANSYLTMSLAMDLHDVWRGFPSREATLGAVDAEFLVVGVEEDRLIPVDEQAGVHRALTEAGKTSRWQSLSSRIGHDAFLVEIDTVNDLVGDFLKADS
jgi:homoserine O-acetyltransferase